ncbi:hypothetical protein [Vibrio atypicus]|uniref:hypothetical protein n=1 Tax=Vibrio atypicus TaxID=558271 RepID=UPI00135CDE72|nr:hypothetical protein [Vibrio atypicus]
MKAKLNTKISIVKSFINWVPLLLASLIFYFVMFGAGIMWLFESYLGFSEVEAREVSFPLAGTLLCVTVFIYFIWSAKILSAFRLEIEGSHLIIKSGGFKGINRKIPINEIEGIYIGSQTNVIENLSGHPAIKDLVASRLVVALKSGEMLKLDLALKAFDSNSLLELLRQAEKLGVQTNISA